MEEERQAVFNCKTETETVTPEIDFVFQIYVRLPPRKEEKIIWKIHTETNIIIIIYLF